MIDVAGTPIRERTDGFGAFPVRSVRCDRTWIGPHVGKHSHRARWESCVRGDFRIESVAVLIPTLVLGLIADLALGIAAGLFQHPAEVGVLTPRRFKVEDQILDAQSKVVE